MPIHPDNVGRYPADWPEISRRIRFDRAGSRCECHGQCESRHHVTDPNDWRDTRCPARHGEPHPSTGSTVVLTVAHLDHTPEHVDDANLVAMCQACHLSYDRDHHAESRRRRALAPEILYGDCRDVLPTLPASSVDVVVTSPPYLRQRKYGDDPREIGLDDTVAAYVDTIAGVFDELRRVLKPHGWAWLNLGDKSNNSGGAGGDWAKARMGQAIANGGPGRFRDGAYPEASFMDVPGAVVAELLKRRWRLRMPIVWDKGKDKPENFRFVRRPRSSHEMIYLLQPGERRRTSTAPTARFYWSALAETGSVWHFPPGSSGDPHLAPFPDELARRCILPTTLPGDVVLDPFSGAGTVARVATRLGRRAIGIELYGPSLDQTGAP